MTQRAVHAPITAQQIDALTGWVMSLRQRQPRWTRAAITDVLIQARDERTDNAELLCRAITRGTLNVRIIAPAELATGTHWDTAHVSDPTVPQLAPTCLTCHGPAHPTDVPHYPPADQIPGADRIRQIRESAGQ